MNGTPNDGGPAFPVNYAYRPKEGAYGDGMSLRDWFAGQAMQGLLASDRKFGKPSETLGEAVARNAYEFADAMIAARARKEGQ